MKNEREREIPPRSPFGARDRLEEFGFNVGTKAA